MATIDRESFERQARGSLPMLRASIRRLVGHPDDTDDLVQQALLQAWERFASFRGDSRFSTWLCAIGFRLAVDFLRRQQRWRARAQVAYANECLDNEALVAEIVAVFASPEFAFEVHEHIAYCFACVGRSLNADEYAAIVLREIVGLGNREAAKILGVSESVLRHRLAAGRRVMADTFEGLCSLVNKNGVCHQCRGLRALASGERQGPEPPVEFSFDARLGFVAASRDDGRSQALHDLFWRRTAELEACGRGSIEATNCGTGD